MTVRVEQSIPDVRPIFVFTVTGSRDRAFLSIENEGWGPARVCSLDIRIFDEKETVASISRTRREIKHGISLDLFELLTPDQAAAVTALRAERQLKVSGSLTYSETTPEQQLSSRRTIRFGPVNFPVPLSIGVEPMPISEKFAILLTANRENYSIDTALAHTLKANEPERLRLVTGAAATSRHRVKIEVHTNDGRVSESGPFDLTPDLVRAGVRVRG